MIFEEIRLSKGKITHFSKIFSQNGAILDFYPYICVSYVRIIRSEPTNLNELKL